MLQETLGRLFAGRRDLARARADGGVGSPDDMLDKARFKVDVKHASAWWRKIALVDHCVARLPLEHGKTKKDQGACEI
jgi:hypothetical protein